MRASNAFFLFVIVTQLALAVLPGQFRYLHIAAAVTALVFAGIGHAVRHSDRQPPE